MRKNRVVTGKCPLLTWDTMTEDSRGENNRSADSEFNLRARNATSLSPYIAIST